MPGLIRTSSGGVPSEPSGGGYIKQTKIVTYTIPSTASGQTLTLPTNTFFSTYLPGFDPAYTVASFVTELLTGAYNTTQRIMGLNISSDNVIFTSTQDSFFQYGRNQNIIFSVIEFQNVEVYRFSPSLSVIENGSSAKSISGITDTNILMFGQHAASAYTDYSYSFYFLKKAGFNVGATAVVLRSQDDIGTQTYRGDTTVVKLL